MRRSSLKPHTRKISLLSVIFTVGATLLLLGTGAALGALVADTMQADHVAAAPPVVDMSTLATPSMEEEPLPPTYTPTPIPSPTPTPLPPTPVPTGRFIVGSSYVNVRSGPDTHYENIGSLAPGEEVAITGSWGSWWQFTYEGRTAWISGDLGEAFDTEYAPPVPWILPGEGDDNALWVTSEDRWIDVDLSEQMLTAYENNEIVKQYLISSGLPNTPTPTGQYRIWIKLPLDDMSGPGYYIPNVPWVMYFHLGYGLHGVTWHGNFGHQMSHGCVNQPTDMAEWLFNFAEVGTLVNIHQ